MKQLITFLIIGIMCISLVVCRRSSMILGDKSKYVISDNLVSMQVKDKSLTKKEAVLILQNHTSVDYVYGAFYAMEYQKNNVWYKIIPNREMNFNMIGYVLKANGSREIKINWEKDYGNLPSGKYRIIKDASINLEQPEGPIDMKDFTPSEIIYISAEFTIE